MKPPDEIVAAYPWPPLTHEANFRQLLGFLAADPLMTDVRWVAYVLATVRHETAFTFAPIEEYGKGEGRPYGKPDPTTGQTYYGRGYVQLTWKDNYARFGSLLGIDLVGNPALALVPETAYAITSKGMVNGLFTGASLHRFISGSNCDYVNARRIINGVDRAELIAGYAKAFESTL